MIVYSFSVICINSIFIRLFWDPAYESVVPHSRKLLWYDILHYNNVLVVL